MKRIAVSLLTIMAVFLLSVTSGFGWGNDIQIYSGRINTFDVDYDPATGTMFLAFQASGEDVIRLYSSTDHGLHWSEITTFGTSFAAGDPARADLHRIRVLFNDGKVFIFWVDSAGYLNRWGCSSSGGSHGGARVSIFPILEYGFSVTLDPESGTMYAAYRSWHDDCYRDNDCTWETIRFSADDGRTWTFMRRPWSLFYSRGLSYQRNCLAFAPGVENHIYSVRTEIPSVNWPPPENTPSFKQIYFDRWPSDDSGHLDRWKDITNSAIEHTDARVAAAYVDDSGVWVVYNRGERGADDQDLLNAYSPNGGITWSYLDQPIAAATGVDEYVADVKYYKAPGNSYVNMVYIKDDPSSTPPRQAIWMYASTADPAWRSPVVFNDEDVQSFPEDTAPRIVYSPGAAASGGGVVFSYAEAQGLYFDAPWIVSAGGFLPIYPGLPVYPVVTSHTLTVTIHGSGSVVSSPVGLDCTHNSLGDTVCTHNFIAGTNVGLTATPINGIDYSSSFGNWSGDCSGHGACSLVMDGDKSVEANFGALGTPVFALPVPAGQEAWNYPPVENPLLLSDPANCKPFAVGDLMVGNLNLQVELPPFSAGVDVFLALEYSGSLFLIDDCNQLKLSSTLTELPRWKTNASFTDISESLYGDIPLALLPSGLYDMYIVVVPTGENDFSHYYFWATYFLAP